MNLKRGEQKNLAKELGITAKHLNDILHGRRHPSLEMAEKLEKHTGIERCAWLYPKHYRNPLMKRTAGPSASSRRNTCRPAQSRSDTETPASNSIGIEKEEPPPVSGASPGQIPRADGNE